MSLDRSLWVRSGLDARGVEARDVDDGLS